jgi:hypothetical protein
MSASAITVVNSAISFYENTFSDPFTVDIAFNNMNSGLGGSSFFLYDYGYNAFSTQLNNDATSADDATANVVAATNNPVNGTTHLDAKSANLRAIGINQTAHVWTAADGCDGGMTGAFDGCIGLNLALTNDTNLGVGGGYSLISVVEHEIDEVLGLGSSLGLGLASLQPSPEDLFRYVSANTRSFAQVSCNGPQTQAFFSIDGGNTMINEFNNCSNGGDYGDWVTHTPTQVQDAFTDNSGTPSLSVTSSEVRALDVIGYTLKSQNNSLPEPATLSLLGVALLGMSLARKSKRATIQ